MSTPAAKRRRINAASSTLSKPFRSPFKTPFKSPLKKDSTDSTEPSATLHPQSSAILSEKNPNFPSVLATPTITPGRVSRAKKTFSSPVATVALINDPDIAPLLRAQRELEKQLRDLNEELEIAEQARKIELESNKRGPKGDVDGELVELIEKWKGASRQAAEELFGKVRDRVNRYIPSPRWYLGCTDVYRMGGPRAWKEMQKRQQEQQGQWDQEELTNNNNNDDSDDDENEEPEVEKRDIYAEYSIDPETENEKSQRERGVGDTGELPGQEDVSI